MDTRTLASASTLTASQRQVAELLARGGIGIDGAAPGDMRLYDPAVLDDALARGNLGLGEGYVAGAWDCERLDQFFDRLLRAHLERAAHSPRLAWYALRAKLLNRQNRRHAWDVGRAHYDLGNEFFAAMLDPRMAYSCG